MNKSAVMHDAPFIVPQRREELCSERGCVSCDIGWFVDEDEDDNYIMNNKMKAVLVFS